MSSEPGASPEPITVTWGSVMGSSTPNSEDPFLSFEDWTVPVSFFVGRNGTGKTRAATALAHQAGGRLLVTDRLVGLMSFSSTGWTNIPTPTEHQGVPLGPRERGRAQEISVQHGTAIDELYALREQPGVWLRVAAFIRRALGRTIEMREQSGFLDPYIRIGDSAYSLLRDEGHGLRELVVLLTAIYRDDWSVLVVDEPELHVHPALARIWLSELETECAAGRRAVVVTHEPSLLRPKSSDDLNAIWFFAQGSAPTNVGRAVLEVQRERVDASLQQNPDLVGQLAFSPRPVLVEGKHDVAALSVALARSKPPEAIAQTDLVECGGTGGVALWFEIARKLGLDVRAIADLDAMFDNAVVRAVDLMPDARERIQLELHAEPPTAAQALRPLHERMSREGVQTDPRSKADWLTSLGGDGDAARRDTLLDIFRGAGVWLHPQGRLEQVLGIEEKGIAQSRSAAAAPGDIDRVVDWSAFALDPRGDVKLFLDLAVERIAHGVVEALRMDPGANFTAPVGPTAESDARLVEITPLQAGRHRITVKTPAEFAGWWLEFSRDTAPRDLVLEAPADGAAGTVAEPQVSSDPRAG